MVNKLFVGNLSFKINKQSLMNFFFPYGKIKDVVLMRKKENKNIPSIREANNPDE